MNKEHKPSRLKAAVYTALNWIGFSFSNFPQWNAYYGQTSDTGVRVTADKAMRLSAVWSCVRLVSQTVSTLPVGAYERTDTGRVAVDLDILPLIRMKPNADMTAPVFWENILSSILLRGDSFAEIKRIGGKIVSLDLLHPDTTTPERTESGAWRYKTTGEDGEPRYISEENMFHIPGFSTCGKFGMSVIEYGADVFGSAMAANQAANKTFANGLHPTVAFKYPQVMKENQRDQARETIADLSGAVNAGKPVILEAGMEAMTIGINPGDAQLLESRNYSINEVCSWFGLYPAMIGHGGKESAWASSSESMNLWWLQYSLRPLLKRIEMAIWDQLLTTKEKAKYYVEFNVEGLLRADTAGRTEFYSTGLQNGWINRNEVRRLENLAPIEGGDTYTVQSNLIPIDKLGEGDLVDAALAGLATEE